MKHIEALVLFLLICMSGNAASNSVGTLTGVVVDKQSNEPLSYTNVFFSNTTLGDAADKNGRFILEKIPAGAYQLVVSRIGYDLHVQQVEIVPGVIKELNVRLVVHSIEGQEVSVTASASKQWRRDLSLFSKYFIGETRNARRTNILNPEVLSFKTAPESGDMLADAQRPLIVENRALGYRIEIILKYFRCGVSGARYLLYPHYSELPAKNKRIQKKWQKARQQTFKDSMRGFWHDLAKGDYRRNYVVSQKTETNLMRTSFAPMQEIKTVVIDSAIMLRRLELKNGLQVQRRVAGASQIYLKYGYIDFDTRGNYYPADGVTVSGYWIKNRIADTLPFDYAPTEDAKDDR